MRRDQLEHLIRAAGQILGEDTVIVIGSQAILASFAAPAAQALVRSEEADLMALEDPDDAKADRIDAVLGSGSQFDDTFGIHADGVSRNTPLAPDGWETRLIEICTANTNWVRGLCMEPNDLVISKLAAGRSKDYDFAEAAVTAGMVGLDVLDERLSQTELDQHVRDRIAGWIAGHRRRPRNDPS